MLLRPLLSLIATPAREMGAVLASCYPVEGGEDDDVAEEGILMMPDGIHSSEGFPILIMSKPPISFMM